jgi:MFS family permease
MSHNFGRVNGPGWYGWYVSVLFCALYTLSFVDRLIVGLLVQPIKADLGLSDTQISLVHGFSFAVFYTLFGLVMGRLADLVNRRNLIAAGVFTWSLMTVFCGAASRFGHLLLLRVGVGVGEAALTPAAYSIITDYFPAEKRSTALSIFSAGAYLGIAVAFTGGAYIYRSIESWLAVRGGLTLPMLGEMHAWQLVFVAVGAPGLILGLLVYTVRESQRITTRAERENKPEAPPLAEVVAYFKANWRSILGHNMGIALITAAAYSRDLWNTPFFERTYGWNLYESGIWYGLVVLVAGVCGVMVGGRLGDQLRKRYSETANILVMLFACLGWLPFGLTYPLMPTPTLSLVFLFPAIFMTAVPYGCAAAAVQEMMPTRMRGVASALMLSANGIIGLGLGPTLVALATDYIFGDEASLRYSLVIVCGSIQVVAALFIFSALKPFQKTLNDLKSVSAQR